MNNKVTQLQKELSLMKARAAKKAKAEKINDFNINNSSIRNLFTKSSMFYLWLFTGILGYLHKIPIIKSLITLLSLWYGRTTWWSLLIKIRKGFIMFNALIGVYAVFKTIGYTPETFWALFSGMGSNYIEIFTNFTTKLYNWFYNLFNNHTPNIPNNRGNKPSILDLKFPKDIPQLNKPLDGFSLRELYKNGTISTDTTSSWYNRLWWTLAIGGTLAALYFGYKFIIDPYILNNITTPTNHNPPVDPTVIAGGGTLPPDSPDISLGDRIIDSLARTSNYVGRGYRGIINRLNPLNLMPSVSNVQEQFNVFMDSQNDMNRANRGLYPFTDVNPYNSWFKRVKIHYLGETAPEFLERTQARMHAERIYESLRVTGQSGLIGGSTPYAQTLFSAPVTPALLGLQPTLETLNPSAFIESWNTPANEIVERKLSQVARTPTYLSTITNDWIEHKPVAVPESSGQASKIVELPSSPSSTPPTIFVEGIKVHENKFSVLADFPYRNFMLMVN